jgi:hypothetical protein
VAPVPIAAAAGGIKDLLNVALLLEWATGIHWQAGTRFGIAHEFTGKFADFDASSMVL